MSYDLSSSINRMTDLYLEKAGLSTKGSSLYSDGIYSLGKGNRKDAVEAISSNFSKADKAKKSFGKEFSDVYDSMQAMRVLDDTMRQSYEINHRNDDKKSGRDSHSALTFSKGSSRIMDMLTAEISSEMDDKVAKAMKDGLEGIGK
ncbi:hypothetical protein [Butyrivibrio sp. VCD2006]|uniref:hypothetical protein n=1 Tax=Butyrivibrio sp. VCD2006 TaxID=1280664 RepID=UPI00040C4D6A|nr:hypothetical protein [Butyrivibrio sp. VCD2006]